MRRESQSSQIKEGHPAHIHRTRWQVGTFGEADCRDRWGSRKRIPNHLLSPPLPPSIASSLSSSLGPLLRPHVTLCRLAIHSYVFNRMREITLKDLKPLQWNSASLPSPLSCRSAPHSQSSLLNALLSLNYLGVLAHIIYLRTHLPLITWVLAEPPAPGT